MTDYIDYQPSTRTPVKVLVDHNEGQPDHIIGEFIGWHVGGLALIDISSTNGYSGVYVIDERLGSVCNANIIAVEDHLIKRADWYVTVYEVDRSYGGSEEGGWWYDSGTVVHERVLETREAAEKMAKLLEDEYPATGSSSSVIYRGGDYRVRISNYPGRNYPTESPRYE